MSNTARKAGRVDFQVQQIKVIFLVKQDRKRKNQTGSYAQYLPERKGKEEHVQKQAILGIMKLYLFSTKYFDFETKIYMDYVALPSCIHDNLPPHAQLFYSITQVLTLRGCPLKQELREKVVYDRHHLSVSLCINLPPHFDGKNVILTDTQLHSPGDLHTLRSYAAQHFQELALH